MTGVPPPAHQVDGASRRTAIRTLSLIAAVCLAPIVASYAIYYFAPLDRQVNYGTLLPTQPAPPLAGVGADGATLRLDALRGKWALLSIAGDTCDAACERGLYATRQARTMQGKDQDRIVRALVLTGGTLPDAQTFPEHPGLVVIRDPAADATYRGPSGTALLIDPLGNLVLRYPQDPDIKRMAKDLARLLKASRIG